jgi:hypothetical protein
MTKQELREQIEAKLDKHDDWTYWCAIGDDSKPEEYSGIELLDDLMTLFDQALIEAEENAYKRGYIQGGIDQLTKPERSDV